MIWSNKVHRWYYYWFSFGNAQGKSINQSNTEKLFCFLQKWNKINSIRSYFHTVLKQVRNVSRYLNAANGVTRIFWNGCLGKNVNGIWHILLRIKRDGQAFPLLGHRTDQTMSSLGHSNCWCGLRSCYSICVIRTVRLKSLEHFTDNQQLALITVTCSADIAEL